MCGVIGLMAYGQFEDKKMEKVRQESMIFLASELLQQTQSRGKDATGVAVMYQDGDYNGLKMGISASEFIMRMGGKETDFDGFLNVWRRKRSPAKMFIGHCRKPSTGTKATTDDNQNNHPIKVGDIVGVHNGTLTNHEKIFTKLGCGRDGLVDSEAIFRLLHHFTENGVEPFTKGTLMETCQRLDGTYACLTFSGNNPYQMAAFRDGRPLELLMIKPLKLLVIASEKTFLDAALFRYNKMGQLYAPAMGFPKLTVDDVEKCILPDNHTFLFDLRQEVSAESNLKDLYISEKIPFTGKMWQKVTTSAYNSKAWKANKTNATGAAATGTAGTQSSLPGVSGTGIKKAEVNASSNPGKQGNSNKKGARDKRSGMAWSRDHHEFQYVGDDDGSVDHGSVEIDVEGGEVKDAITKSVVVTGEKKLDSQSTSSVAGQSTALSESSDPLSDIMTPQADIKEIRVKSVSPAEKPKKHVPKLSLVESGKSEGKEKIFFPDTSDHPDVLEMAVKATKEMPNFSTDGELADAIEVKHPASMAEMPLFAFANRVKAFFYRIGWFAGYVACLNRENAPIDADKGTRTMMLRLRKKSEAARKTIRVMKSLVRILDETIGDSQYSREKLAEFVAEALSNGKELDPEALDYIFKAGDQKNMPAVRRAIETIKYLHVG